MERSLSSFISICSVSLLLCFMAYSTYAQSTNTLFLEPPPPGNHRHYSHLHHLCNSFNRKRPPSICSQTAASNHHRRRPFPPPPPDDDDIDPRYGVQKRLIPSGPNPLHN